jgi:hypothetical protein
MKHIIKQPFVFATGIAALIHSTWSLGTFFAGEQPVGWHLIGWLVPALLIAFALDIGQIVTSAEIRSNGLTVARGVTFMVFALATYYLQWLYIAHHMPSMPLSDGISPDMQAVAMRLRDMALWIIPALMPLSTLLYTFSSDNGHDTVSITPAPQPAMPEILVINDEPLPMIEEYVPFNDIVDVDVNPLFNSNGNAKRTKQCDHCGTSFQSRSPNARFCSDSCRVLNHKATKLATPVNVEST